MGLFDSIATQAKNAVSNAADTDTTGGAQPGIMEAVAGLISGSGDGGLQALITNFREKGFGNAIASWISTGQNLPISGEQLQSVLGSEQVQAIAQKLGISTADASNSLANVLPQVIDKLTPNGQVPEGNLIEQGLALLKGFGTRT